MQDQYHLVPKQSGPPEPCQIGVLAARCAAAAHTRQHSTEKGAELRVCG